MSTDLRKMPIGIQDFEDLRTNGYMYVDKTAYLYRLVTRGKPYFLGRPRRFGKSLFLSTLKAYFLGKKELFEGLAIAELEKDWTVWPVIYIDFNRGSNDCLQSVKNLLSMMLDDYESEWRITEKYSDLPERFSRLIKTAYEKSGKKVVVLIDEYDKALLYTMYDSEKNDALRESFKGFYGVLKGMDYCLRFVFLTGVTKFSKVSIFSDLNQLIDISLDEQYAGVCGISETELLQYFRPEIGALAEKCEMTFDGAFAEMKKRYDGYRFAKEGEDMYNPFSVLNVFNSLDFGYYWFQTGTPTFLVKALRNSLYDIRKFNGDVIIDVISIMDYRVGESSLTPLLYQSGYLTIKSYNKKIDAYTLGFPNDEVKYGFLKELLPAYIPKWGLDDSFSVAAFVMAIQSGVVDDFMKLVKAYFASIPYDLEDNKDKDEKYFQSIFYQLFTLAGQFIKKKKKSAEGRSDAVVKTADSIYVFEFKMDAAATAEDALAQIDSKGYLIPYTADSRRLVKIGVEFSVEAKGIKRWLWVEH
jgi:hypothetical protein